jgi:hypothetical protein
MVVMLIILTLALALALALSCRGGGDAANCGSPRVVAAKSVRQAVGGRGD